jgi:hypothetical protein
MLETIKNYIGANPNFLQIASTAVIGIIAFVVWSFTLSTIAAFLQQKKPHSAVASGRSRIARSEVGFFDRSVTASQRRERVDCHGKDQSVFFILFMRR